MVRSEVLSLRDTTPNAISRTPYLFSHCCQRLILLGSCVNRRERSLYVHWFVLRQPQLFETAVLINPKIDSQDRLLQICLRLVCSPKSVPYAEERTVSNDIEHASIPEMQ